MIKLEAMGAIIWIKKKNAVDPIIKQCNRHQAIDSVEERML